MRLGELLVADGLIAPHELEAALAQHRRSGGRLGSILYLSGRITADAIARALARQHGVPAALVRHLDGRDPTLAGKIPGDVARRWLALPVALSRGRDGASATSSLVVCMRDPGDAAAVSALTAAAGMTVVAAVACEAVLAAHVGRAYPDDDGDGIDVVFDEVSGTYAIPLDTIDPTALMLVDLDDKRVARDHTQTSPMPTAQRLESERAARASGAIDRRDTAPQASQTSQASQASGATAAPPASSSTPSSTPSSTTARSTTAPEATSATPRASTAPPVAGAEAPAPLDCDATITALSRAVSRDAVGDLALAFLRSSYGVGVVLVVRDNMALGHRGFGGSLTPGTVESIVVPLHLPSMLRTAYDGGRPFVGAPPTDAGTIQDRFLRLLGSPREVVVVPVVLRDRAVCLVFAAQPSRADDDALDDLLTVVAAMEEAYLRLIRDAKKAPGATTPPVEPG